MTVLGLVTRLSAERVTSGCPSTSIKEQKTGRFTEIIGQVTSGYLLKYKKKGADH